MEQAFPGYSAAQAVRSGGRAPLRLALLAARRRTLAWADAYAAALAANGMHVPLDAALNPPLWELGHIGWFQEYWVGRNRQRSRGVACDPGHPRAPSLLAQADAWYDSGQVEHASRWELPLPGDQDTRGWLAATLAQTLDLLDRLPPDAGDDDLYFFRLVALHEDMHAEAACYMARSLDIPLTGLSGVADGARHGIAGQGSALQVPAQAFRLGWDGPGFAFDNELGAQTLQLRAFEIDAAPVSWARFMPFVAAGGYGQQRWWNPAGWEWLQQTGRKAAQPAAADAQEPAVHLSAWEAEAWCRWAGRRLPGEAEWECAALTMPGFAWGSVWEWTASPFLPYPGFAPHPYRDYSAPWFGSRRVLRGACAATSPSLAHPRYRNFFEPGRCDVFAGFRSCA